MDEDVILVIHWVRLGAKPRPAHEAAGSRRERNVAAHPDARGGLEQLHQPGASLTHEAPLPQVLSVHISIRTPRCRIGSTGDTQPTSVVSEPTVPFAIRPSSEDHPGRADGCDAQVARSRSPGSSDDGRAAFDAAR